MSLYINITQGRRYFQIVFQLCTRVTSNSLIFVDIVPTWRAQRAIVGGSRVLNKGVALAALYSGCSRCA